MLKVYFLRQLKDLTTNTEYTEGQDYISQAISETTEDPKIRRVIIEEKPELDTLTVRTEIPTQRDIDNYNKLPEPSPPSRDLATEIDDLRARVGTLEKI